MWYANGFGPKMMICRRRLEKQNFITGSLHSQCGGIRWMWRFFLKPPMIRLGTQKLTLPEDPSNLRNATVGSHSLDCFKCVSVGGDNQPCEDPFHNNYTKDILEAPCWAGRKQRDGVFPATACIKLSGIYGMIDRNLIKDRKIH
ncbi:uncharacterized protein TNCV_911641 [Trichonephila clavipes]|nr:uncharacterized protein TNCV_911641 [Trichonephila clavipes]